MKLDRITLRNIRSYINETIEFPEGSTLLSGDIGSGKTSILLGIEFGLFGLQPGQKGASLLRNGEKEGGVILEFEVDGKKVVVERILKKGKGVTQDYCSMSIDKEAFEISVSELKDKILEILEYPKEFAKKQNLLYKFTVYTPQEEMKQIILQDAETRINTLRHVFGIDRYKKILENLSILLIKLREEKRIKQALTLNIEEEKQEIIKKENNLETKHYNLASVEKELFAKKSDREKIQEEMAILVAKVEEKKDLEKEIEKTRLGILHKKDVLSGNNLNMQKIKSQLEGLSHIVFDEAKIHILENYLKNLRSQKDLLSEKNLEISSKITSLELRNRESQILIQKIKEMDICPTCLQDVDSNYKANMANSFDSNISENKKRISQLLIEKSSIVSEKSKTEMEILQKEKELQDLRILKVKIEGVNEKKKNMEDIEKINSMLEKDLLLLNQHVDSLKSAVFEFSKYDRLFEEKKKELDEALKQERIVEIKIAELRKEIEVFSRQIEELKIKVQKSEAIKLELDYIIELENWLSKQFAPVISNIEKNVMTKLKTEFSKLFAEWFSMLVSETFQVGLLDDFTPVIQQQDYEIDYAYLSGGERTAVALAYRLALNQVINSLLSKIKTRDFIILDEPTDGFSEAQLDKMREVLEQLNVRQLIIVSHEQKIEGFVENVVKFKKEAGISKRVS